MPPAGRANGLSRIVPATNVLKRALDLHGDDRRCTPGLWDLYYYVPFYIYGQFISKRPETDYSDSFFFFFFYRLTTWKFNLFQMPQMRRAGGRIFSPFFIAGGHRFFHILIIITFLSIIILYNTIF